MTISATRRQALAGLAALSVAGHAGCTIAARLAARLGPTGLPWRFVYTTGEAARGLSLVADEHDARMIVVGTHRPGLMHWMNQLVSGSVAGAVRFSRRR